MSTENNPESLVVKKVIQVESVILEKLKEFEAVVTDTDLSKAIEDLIMTCKGRHNSLSSLIEYNEDERKTEQNEELKTTLTSDFDRVAVEGILKGIEAANTLYINELAEVIKPQSKKYFEIFKEETEKQYRNIVELAKEKGLYTDDGKIALMQVEQDGLNDAACTIS